MGELWIDHTTSWQATKYRAPNQGLAKMACTKLQMDTEHLIPVENLRVLETARCIDRKKVKQLDSFPDQTDV